MNAWNLTQHCTGPVPAGSSNQFIATLIDAIGEPDFGKTLIAHLNELVYIDFLSIYQLSTASVPRMYLSSSMSEVDVSADCFRSYQRKLHTQDHTFDSAKDLAKANGLSMTYSHQTHFSQAHREAIYARHGIQDRLSIVCDTGDGNLFATNLYRFERHRQFGPRDVDAVESVAQAVAACIRKHISAGLKQAFLDRMSAPRLSAVLIGLCPRLTARELDVCAGLLRGRTYDGIAADMGISLATVKTYRARAYEKLGIHFKSQLFAMASRFDGESGSRLSPERTGDCN